MKRSVLALLLCSVTFLGCSPEQPSTFAKADELFRARDFQAVTVELESLRAQLGEDPDLVLRLGVSYEYLDDPAKAVITYKRGLEAHPDAGKLWVALGNMYLQLSEYERAKEALLEGRERGVEDRHTAFSLGRTLGQLRELEAAEAEFERALAAGGDASSIRFHVAVLRLEQQRFREAVEILEAVVADDPTHVEAVRELGNALLAADSGNPATVERVMRMAWEVVDAQPEEYRGHMLLGDAFMANEDFEAAVEAYTEALRHGKNPPEVEDRYVAAATRKKAAEDK